VLAVLWDGPRKQTDKEQDMKKVIAAFNMTLDGICDHTGGLPDEEIHQHYTELLGQGAAILYGRTTYQLLEFWRTFLENPSQEKSMNDFAKAIDKISKIVFSHTLKNVDWESATIANRDVKETVLALKQQPGNDIFIGSRSLILQLMKLNLVDEYQICVHPVIAGNGLPLFENISDRIIFKLVKTKSFKNGAVTLYYQPKE
jgi:dihydrofolate reductase